MQNIISNQPLLWNKLQLYSIFRLYYQNLLWNEKQWDSIIEQLQKQKDYIMDDENMDIFEGISLLTKITNKEIEVAKFDFNRLFVGPNHLLAPPFASHYLNRDRVLMQNGLMIGRNIYRNAGIEVKNIDIGPDDHIGLELEFICYLLSQIISSENEKTANAYDHLLTIFLEYHFLKWVPAHCDDAIKHSQSKICTGMAFILKGLTCL